MTSSEDEVGWVIWQGPNPLSLPPGEDDLIVFGKSLEEHEERLLKVLDRLAEVGLKISLDKCQFCQPEVKYLGHIVSAQGVSPDPQKIVGCHFLNAGNQKI
uniref:ribonuclease H n=1 Tax=Knipowitschia caucasica TaxID=637954 RepID=A0AAV2LMI1_KNICA